MQQTARDQQPHGNMASDLEKKVANELSTVSKMSKYDFEPYWPAKKLRICITGKMQQPTRCCFELFMSSIMLATLCGKSRMLSGLLCPLRTLRNAAQAAARLTDAAARELLAS